MCSRVKLVQSRELLAFPLILNAELISLLISNNMEDITAASQSTPKAQTTKNMNLEYSSLEEALNVALEGVTKLVGQLKGDTNLVELS